MSETKILRCTCAHPAQDRLHGADHRVHNWAEINAALESMLYELLGVAP